MKNKQKKLSIKSDGSYRGFCICGISISGKEFANILKFNYDNEKIREYLKNLEREYEIEWLLDFKTDGSSHCYFGYSLSEMKDEETLAQFKIRTKKRIENIFEQNLFDNYYVKIYIAKVIKY